MTRAGFATLLGGALLLAGPVSAIPPALGQPEEKYPLLFDEWKGHCFARTGCWAERPWNGARIVVGVTPRDPYAWGSRSAYLSYIVYRPCAASELSLRGDLELPLASESDVAAHMRTALQNETDPCGGQALDDATAASVTRLVRLFTVAGGIAAPVRDGPPGDTDYNRHPINPDIWIDEVADYPALAKERRQGGRVAAQLTIRDDLGRPVMCNVTESSGVAALDEATCTLLMRNARFRVEPKGGTSHYTARVNWDIGRIPVPFCVLCEVGPDGVRRPQEFDSRGRRVLRPTSPASR